MKKSYLILALTALTALSAQAETRSRKEAQAIAIEHAQSLGIEVSSNQLRRCVVSNQSEENAPYYVFNNGNDQGWTIVSGDDRTADVLGYSTEGSFDWDQIPEVVKVMLGGFEKNLTTLDDVQQRKLAPRKAGTTTKPIGPLCVTKWDQYTPYSDACPTVSSGKHAATCCVATAFAQILYYLYYTKGKQESTTFTKAIPTPTNTAGYKGSAVAANDRTYEWAKMLPDYAGKAYTEEQAAAVAKLMADIGSSFNVKYGTSSSTSTTDDYMSSLTSSSYPSSAGPTYWGIAKTSDLSYNGNVSSVSAWHTAIDGELNKYYPVQIGGAGHAFVCDGRDSNNMYHMNFGYDGRGDGFYSFDAIDGYGTSMRVTYGMRLESTYPTSGLDKLQVVYDAAQSYLNEEPVGEVPGYYQQSYYDELSAKLATAKTYLDSEGEGMTSDELTSFAEEISAAQQTMLDRRTPYLTGTYYLKSFAEHGTTDVVMYGSGTGAKYGPINTTSDNYKWELTYNEEANGYTIKNVGSGKYLNSVSSSSVTLGTNASVYCEVWPTNRIEDGNTRYTNDYWSVSYTNTIRPIVSGYRDTDHGYVVINYGDGVAGTTSGTLIGWQPYNDWDVWVPVPVDVNPVPEAYLEYEELNLQIGETGTNKLTTNSTGRVGYTSSNTAVAKVSPTGVVTAVDAGTATITVKISKTDDYSAKTLSYTVNVAEDAQIRSALDSLLTEAQSLYTDEELKEAQDAASEQISDGLITDYTAQFTSPYTEKSEGAITNLNDGNAATFWHSAWSGGSVAAGTHYFEVELNEALTSEILIKMTRRSNATDDHVTQFTIYSSSDGTTYGEEGAVVDFAYGSANETVEGRFTPCDDCKKLKFVCTATTSNRGYFHMGEFQIYSVTYAYPTEAQKALIDLGDAVDEAKAANPAHQADVDALQAAIDAYKPYKGGEDALQNIELVQRGTVKYLKDNKVIIRRNGSEYNTNGIEIK